VFIAVFSIFLLAIVVLCVVTIRWAIHRDRERRANADPSPGQKS
jgi:hypothetical protein